MKLSLVLFPISCVMLANGYSNYYSSPYTNNCGIQLTRGKGGGIYYASATSTGDGGQNQRDRDYYGSYGNGGSNNYVGTGGWSSSSYDAGSSGGGQAGYGSSDYGSTSGGSGSSSSFNNAGASPIYDQFVREVLIGHNNIRERHSTPALKLDRDITSEAQTWAESIASGDVAYGHSPFAIEGIYGESIQVIPYTPKPSGYLAVDRWYEEGLNYNWRKPEIVRKPANLRNNHFTALLWYGTKKIGVGKATNKNGDSVVVVMYYPPGNNVEVLEQNVFPEKISQ